MSSAGAAQPVADYPPLCVPVASAQAMAGADALRWQQLYAHCLAEVQRLRDAKAPQPLGLWQILPPPGLIPAY